MGPADILRTLVRPLAPFFLILIHVEKESFVLGNLYRSSKPSRPLINIVGLSRSDALIGKWNWSMAMDGPGSDDNNSYESLFRQGTELLHRGRPGEALPFLRSAFQLKDDDVDAAINLSGALILLRKFREARRILEPFSEMFPENVMVWINLGAATLGNPVLARDKEQIEAIAAFRRALELDPAAPSVAYNIGLVYEDRNEICLAIEWFGKAVEANPKDDHARRKIQRLEKRIQEEGDK